MLFTFSRIEFLGFGFRFLIDPHVGSMSSGGKGKGSKKDGVGGGMVCAHCKQVGEIGTMKRCGRCHRVNYCSVACQKLHWKSGGHKGVCGTGSSSSSDTTRGGATGEGGEALKHPCPICLDNEDNAGESGMCFACGQLYCGGCKESMAQQGVADCPTCRAELFISVTEEVRRLRLLLARPAGRHTMYGQCALGDFYATGRGGTQDDAEAARWYRLSADQGNAVAQTKLGQCYAAGSGVAHDDAEAARWYRLSADQGRLIAQYNLGLLYSTGCGVARDDAEAARWYRRAADQGNAGAQYNLGVCYASGCGVAQNDAEAIQWYRRAADERYAAAASNLGGFYALGRGVARDYVQAVRWHRVAADQGDATSQYVLGMLYASGLGVTKDHTEATRWYRLAADQGDMRARTALARLLK
jgi:TPR repeat protein